MKGAMRKRNWNLVPAYSILPIKLHVQLLIILMYIQIVYGLNDSLRHSSKLEMHLHFPISLVVVVVSF